MAKKINKSFAEELRSSAYVWLGEVEHDDMYLLLINFNKTTHWVVVQEDSETLIIKGLKETTCLDREIFDALYEINPAWKKKHIGILNISSFPALKITKDCNNTLFKRGIKPLKETTVIPFLTSLGADVSSYTYTHLVVDNTHNLQPNSVTKGYSNYSKEANQFMVDTSKYKTYTMDKKEEFEMLDMGCFCGIIAAGPAGTGKSTDPLIYCAKNEIPVIVFQCTPGTEEDAIIGNFIPNTSGGFSLKRGPLANAIEQDCWLVINEANYVPSGILSCLNSVMDDNAQVLLDDGSILKRGPNFRIVLTVNPGYRGTNMFNEATLNRFATVYYEPISKEVLIERLQQESGYKNKKVLEAIAEQFDKLRGIYQSKNMETEVTYRNVLRFLKMVLLAPQVSIEKQFDMAFINSTIFEMNDIDTEIVTLRTLRTDMLSSIKSALDEGTEDVTEASWSCSPSYDFDELINQIGDDGSLLDELPKGDE
jgi:hypothetical protein